MKKLNCLAGFILFLFCLQANAQPKQPPINTPDYNKPKIFSDLPESMQPDMASLNRLFYFKKNEMVNLMLSPEFNVKGTVISSGESNGVKTVMIRIPGRNNAIMSFSKFMVNNSSQYTGRIFSRDNGDALLLEKMEDVYVFRKIGLYDLISE